MPPQVAKTSGFLAKMGAKARQAHEAHKADETTYSQFGDLPGGISNGLAELVDAKIDTYKEGNNKGQYYLYLAGVVVTPVSVTTKDGVEVRVEGLRTSQTLALCDTQGAKPRSFDDNYARALNELRKLGVNTEEMSVDDLEPTLHAMATSEEKIRFVFDTREGKATEQYPTPRVFHEWKGLPGGGVSLNGQAHDPGAAVEDQSDANPDGAADEQQEDSGEEAPDLNALAEAADEGDKEARKQLMELARAAGISDKTMKDAEKWTDVVALMGGGEGGGEDEAPADEFNPQKDEVYDWFPTVNGKKSTKKVEVTIVAVNKAKKTVDVKRSDSKATVKGVPYTDLA